MSLENNSQIADMADELVITTLTGGYDLIGFLLENPVQIIFDNQDETNAVAISNNATSNWKTFSAGEALVLDMRSNHGMAANFTFRKGMKLYAKGPAGSTNFRISYTYAVT